VLPRVHEQTVQDLSMCLRQVLLYGPIVGSVVCQQWCHWCDLSKRTNDLQYLLFLMEEEFYLQHKVRLIFWILGFDQFKGECLKEACFRFIISFIYLVPIPVSTYTVLTR
jgi:hypothetical protein